MLSLHSPHSNKSLFPLPIALGNDLRSSSSFDTILIVLNIIYAAAKALISILLLLQYAVPCLPSRMDSHAIGMPSRYRDALALLPPLRGLGAGFVPIVNDGGGGGDGLLPGAQPLLLHLLCLELVLVGVVPIQPSSYSPFSRPLSYPASSVAPSIASTITRLPF